MNEIEKAAVSDTVHGEDAQVSVQNVLATPEWIEVRIGSVTGFRWVHVDAATARRLSVLLSHAADYSEAVTS